MAEIKSKGSKVIVNVLFSKEKTASTPFPNKRSDIPRFMNIFNPANIMICAAIISSIENITDLAFLFNDFKDLTIAIIITIDMNEVGIISKKKPSVLAESVEKII